VNFKFIYTEVVRLADYNNSTSSTIAMSASPMYFSIISPIHWLLDFNHKDRNRINNNLEWISHKE